MLYLNTAIMLNDNEKEDHNTDVSDGIKKFFMVNLIKNLNTVPYQGT